MFRKFQTFFLRLCFRDTPLVFFRKKCSYCLLQHGLKKQNLALKKVSVSKPG